MAERKPLVSIGLAVYNGEDYLEDALNSILRQTFTDYELIISDNASTDRTGEICRDYAAKDSRIRYYRNDRNIGGANNENLTFQLSRGQYFRWAAHDDVCAPRLLETCVAILDQDPSVVLCHTIVVQIDERGNPLRVINREHGGASKPHERFKALARLDHFCEETYGLIRSDIMRKTQLQLNYTDSDRTLLAQLSLYGRFHQVPEPLFYKRIHPKMSVLKYKDWRDRMAWFAPNTEERIVLPHWSQFFHYLQIIASAPVTPYDRIECYKYMLRWLILEPHGKRMVKDIFLALQKTLARPRPGASRGNPESIAH